VVIKGTIFHHKNFTFKDGDVSSKLLVLLNTPSRNDPYLFIKTTSQQKGKSKTPGCDEKRSLFFVPANTAFFEFDTWVQLYEIYPFPPDDVQRDPDFVIINILDDKTTSAIIDCLYRSNKDDIPEIYDGLIRPPLEKSLQQLKEKFRKKF